MLLLGPKGGNLELGSDDITFRGKDGSIVNIPFDQILSVKIVDGYRIEISFTDLRPDLLRVKTLCQAAIDVAMLQEVFSRIKSALDGFVDRPKKVLVFVNPGCGTYRGLSIYEEEVDPIFALSGISTEVVVSQSHGEGRRHLLTKDLTGFDGIVVVGGDGTFSDIAQGLLERSQRDAGLDIRKRVADVEHGSEVGKEKLEPFFNIPSTKFVSNTIPIGHIPGGSGNGYATTLTGAFDPTSSAILIALGKTAYTDVTTVAQLDPCPIMDPTVDVTETLNKTASSFCDFSVLMGCITNLDVKALFEMDNNMRKRFGPFRYFLYPFIIKDRGGVFLRVRHPDRRSHNEQQSRVCRSNCTICDHSRGDVKTIFPPATNWEETTVRERQIVSILVSPVRHKLAPKLGPYPYFHTGDGLLQMLSMSYVPQLKQMLHWIGWLRDDFYSLESSPFHIPADELVVENASKSDIPVYAIMEESSFTVTGTLHCKVLNKFLKTYGTGLRDMTVEPQKPSMSVSSFLLRKTIKAAAVIGFVGLLGVGTYKFVIKDGKWRKLADGILAQGR